VEIDLVLTVFDVSLVALSLSLSISDFSCKCVEWTRERTSECVSEQVAHDSESICGVCVCYMVVSLVRCLIYYTEFIPVWFRSCSLCMVGLRY